MRLPLEDLRVVAVEQFGAGPFGTMQLADLGASVIKVEDPQVQGDVGRSVPPFVSDGTSLFFESFNRGKGSIALDLRDEEQRRAFEELVRHADAVCSNLRGDQPAKLRIRYSDLAPINPKIVCVSLSGFGMTGPRSAQGAYDVTVQALAGWMSVTGGPAEPPTKSGLSLVDFAGGYVAALGLLAAVWRARRDGAGCDVDLSLFETALSLLTYMGTWSASQDWIAQRMADSAHQSIIPFQMFPTADGYLVVACATETLWRKLCASIGRPALADDERFIGLAARSANREAVVAELKKTFRQRSAAEWIETLTVDGIPCAPVNDIATALSDPQVEARGSIVEFMHPSLGPVRTVASPFGRHMTRPPVRAPLLGETEPDTYR